MLLGEQRVTQPFKIVVGGRHRESEGSLSFVFGQWICFQVEKKWYNLNIHVLS